MNLPEHVINKLQDESIRLNDSFSRIWGLLSPSSERDQIMHHILSAKIKLNDVIKEEINNGN